MLDDMIEFLVCGHGRGVLYVRPAEPTPIRCSNASFRQMTSVMITTQFRFAVTVPTSSDFGLQWLSGKIDIAHFEAARPCLPDANLWRSSARGERLSSVESRSRLDSPEKYSMWRLTGATAAKAMHHARFACLWHWARFLAHESGHEVGLSALDRPYMYGTWYSI
jgi:hypothetical protein